MFVPPLSRFKLNINTNRYERRLLNNEKVFTISIYKDNWNKKTSYNINYWLKKNKDLTATFPYGIIKLEKTVNINDVVQNRCEYCGKKLKNFNTKTKHMEKCKHKDSKKENTHDELVTAHNVREPVHNTNITNHNITVNNTYLQICDYGKENQEWLTKDLLSSVFLDRKTAVKNLIRNKHFNENFPENQNIRIDNKNNMNKRLQVFSRGKWRVRETKPVIDLAFINTHEIISDLLNIDEPPFDDDHQAQVIKEFQSTDKFQSMYSRLMRKWEDFGACLKEEDSEFQEYWEYIKTLLLDKKLLLDQQTTQTT
jgi:hypothetical protein